MNRRDTLKTLFVGTVAGVGATTLGCKTEGVEDIPVKVSEEGLYGRTPSELKHDKQVRSETFFSAHEMETIAILCDIILPATATAGSATEAEVPAFVEFIVKDLPDNQLPMRGGLMWIDGEAKHRFGKTFKDITEAQRIAIVDDIAYPVVTMKGQKKEKAETEKWNHGISFFNRMRNLTLSGYYTTRMGLDDLGYDGNRANLWDGVPPEVLAEHDVDYDPAWLAKCVDQEKRNDIAVWDDEGNLLS